MDWEKLDISRSNKIKNGTVILGAGLAGLSAAYHGGGKVFESSNNSGGACRSPKINGYVFDLGIHILHTTNKYILQLLHQDLKIKFNNQERVGNCLWRWIMVQDAEASEHNKGIHGYAG